MDYLSKTPREPRVFLLVMKAGKFSDGEKMMRQMQEDFGPRINESTIVLFTHGDLLEYRIMEEYIDKIPGLKELIEECGGRYQVFSNTDISDRKQVRNLFELIEKIAFVRAELKARQLKRMEELVQQQQRELEELLQAQQQNLNVLIKKHKNQIEELLKREGKLQEEAPKSKSWIPFLK
ncbi:GIMA5 GTPase, partial [Amia calva]|nr:GIMA5 GTPase [Amia calva]